jgi:hypothetical protein
VSERKEHTQKKNLTEQKISLNQEGLSGIVNLQSLTAVGTNGTEDTYIRITCDADLPLENRINLLAYVFAKAVQGEVLRRIIKWDLSNGCVQFVIAANHEWDHPRGKVSVERISPKDWENEYNSR